MSVDLSTAGILPALGLIGQLADLDKPSIISKVTSTALDFGLGVKKTGKDTCAVVSNAADVVAGFSIRDTTLRAQSSGLAYQVGDAVGIIEDGRIWLSPYENVTADAAIYCRASDGRPGVTNTGAPVLNGKWEEAIAADGIGRARVIIIA